MSGSDSAGAGPSDRPARLEPVGPLSQFSYRHKCLFWQLYHVNDNKATVMALIITQTVPGELQVIPPKRTKRRAGWTILSVRPYSTPVSPKQQPRKRLCGPSTTHCPSRSRTWVTRPSAGG